MYGMFHFHNFFLNVVISLSLNDSAHNILNDVLKIMFNGLVVKCYYVVPRLFTHKRQSVVLGQKWQNYPQFKQV